MRAPICITPLGVYQGCRVSMPGNSTWGVSSVTTSWASLALVRMPVSERSCSSRTTDMMGVRNWLVGSTGMKMSSCPMRTSRRAVAS